MTCDRVYLGSITTGGEGFLLVALRSSWIFLKWSIVKEGSVSTTSITRTLGITIIVQGKTFYVKKKLSQRWRA
jgi:hypothetical protein